MDPDRPALSPSKVEKAKEVIDFLSSISLPQRSGPSSSSSTSGNSEAKDGTATELWKGTVC